MEKSVQGITLATLLFTNLAVAQTTLQELEQRISALERDNSFDVTFYGYARFGLNFDDAGEFANNIIRPDGETAPISVGRLGNESYGGEFGVIKPFTGINDTNWKLDIFVDDFGDGIQLRKFNMGVSNVFASQPDLYIWAGRDFHQRPQEGINDYFFMNHDGQGGGFKKLNLGIADFDFAVVQRADDNDRFAATSKLSMAFSPQLKLDLLTNYGFRERSAVNLPAETAWQIGAMLDYSGHKVNLRYSQDADNSVFDITPSLSTIYASYQRITQLTNRFSIENLFAVHMLQQKSDPLQDRINYSAILRPAYFWTDVHSTWLEAGYSVVDYDSANDSNTAWKITLSQNISLQTKYLSRPMLRFFVTTGQADNKVSTLGTAVTPVASANTTKDAFILGAMFESWW